MNQQVSLDDPLKVPIGSITRSKTQGIQERLIGLILNIWINKLEIYNSRSFYTFWVIFEATKEILLQFQLIWKLDISSFSFIYGRPSNSSKEKMTCLKLGPKLL
jgi:hypothetical protein